MREVLKKFGRFFLLDLIAQGGMAEIYRARLASAEGASRLLVIKRIQPGYGNNLEFLQMFKSEIKVMMGFSHPNIVQLYDFGEEQSQPYIAMEYIDGKNLRQFISAFAHQQQAFPVELAVYIMEQAASGLSYAHNFKDKITGEPLSIVHRDISPQNVLISYEGNVKVIDFGIAKATALNNELTRAGVIKGKPSYLSPEQISGESLDGRSDIFALGVVFWEVLAGKKLFSGENDLAVLKLIESSQSHIKPPSTVNPQVPQELDAIVMKALAKRREERYQTAEDFRRALQKFLYTYLPEFNSSDLGYYAKDLFKNEIVEDRKRIQRLNGKAEKLLDIDVSQEIPNLEDPSLSKGALEETTTVVDRKNNPENTGARELPNPYQPEESASEPAAGNKPGAPGSGVKPKLLQLDSISLEQRARISRVPRRYAGPVKQRSISFKAVAALVLAATGFLAYTGQIQVPAPIAEIVRNFLPAEQPLLVLQGNQSGVVVTVNDQIVASTLPATIRDLPVGVPIHVSVTGPSGIFQEDVVINRGQRKVVPVVLRTPASVPAPPHRTVLLRLKISPVGGTPAISVNGDLVDYNNPVKAVPLDDTIEVDVDRAGYVPFKRQFVIESGRIGDSKEQQLDVTLDPVRFGFLTIHSIPSADVTIMIDGKPWIKKTPLENEKFPVGTYNIRLTNDLLGMEKSVTVSIEESKIATVDERLDIKN